MVLRFPRASRSSRLPSLFPSVAAAVFGWLLCNFWLIGGHLRPRRIFFLLSPYSSPPNDTSTPSPSHAAQRASPLSSPLTLPPTFGWLLCLLTKRRPPKAKTLPPSLFFDGLHCNAPNEQTSDSEHKPDSSRPAHGVGKRRRHDLMAPLLYPWRERAKATGG